MSDYREGISRWWGWGNLDKVFDVENRAHLIPYLESRLGMKLGQDRFTDPSLEEIELPEPRVPEAVLAALRRICGDEDVSLDRFQRVSHSMGKSYRDLLRYRLRRIDHPADVVVWPESEEEIVEILRLAEEHRLAVIPFGGGSSVTGGVEPLTDGMEGSITMDLARLNRLLHLDAVSQVAVFEAGALGPEIEDQLNPRGFTLGHFPESFHHSSLGGWIATRASGRQSTGYGDIEDMVLALRMVTPRGVVETRKVPSTAAGPSILQMCVGSEGVMGIITQATVRVRPLPEVLDYRGLIFKDFASGVEAIREMMQQDLVPTCVRLSNDEETGLAQAIRKTTGKPWKRKAEDLALKFLERFGYSFESGSLMILGLEGSREEVDFLRAGILRICRRFGGLHLGTSPGKQWYETRYDTAYFREQLLNWGVMVDTLETATVWEDLVPLYEKVRDAIRDAIAEDGFSSIVACHVSHAYRDGASLYYTFLAPMAPEGQEEAQWERTKKAASDAIMDGGGTITHHHGIGYEHAPWMRREVGEVPLEALKSLKKVMDPVGILNPGKLIPRS